MTAAPSQLKTSPDRRRLLCAYMCLRALEVDVSRHNLPFNLSALFLRPTEALQKELTK
jgi:hypothetical protein